MKELLQRQDVVPVPLAVERVPHAVLHPVVMAMAAAVVMAAVEDAVVAVAASEKFQKLPHLGVGVGYRQPFRTSLFACREHIEFLEITADHFFATDRDIEDELQLLRNNFQLIPHGLALSLGSAEGIDVEYLKLFSRIVSKINPPWCSDHIAFTRAGGIDIGHLTPIPKSNASLRVLKDNISRVLDRISTPLILENITESIQYPYDEYDDAEFLNAICDQNDVGILLDVTNLYINSVNHRFCPLKVVERLPADRIVQVHFVGGRFENGHWIDSHGETTQPEIWDLLSAVLAYADVKGMILERDERIPPLEDLLPELIEAKRRETIAVNLRCNLKSHSVESTNAPR